MQLGSWCSCSWCRWHRSKRRSTLHARRKSTSPCKESLTETPQSNVGPISTRMPLPKIACDLFLLFFEHSQPQVTSNFLPACFAHRPTPNGPLVPQEWQATSQPIHRHGFSQKESTLLYIAHVITDLIAVIQRQRRQTPQCPGKSQKYPRIQIITVQLGSWCSCSWYRRHRSKRRFTGTLHARKSISQESLTAIPYSHQLPHLIWAIKVKKT